MQVEVGKAQWIGERQRQEDAAGYALGAEGRFALVLADGMGGMSEGNLASRLAVEAALASLLEEGQKAEAALSDALNRANLAIAKEVEAHPDHEGMGTTLVCATIENGAFQWSSVGDSHLYLWRGGKLNKVNADHSMRPVLRKMVETGELSEEAAASDPKRNVLRSAIAGKEIALSEVRKTPVPLEKGDILLLASDGLDTLDEGSISRIMPAANQVMSMQALADALVEEVRRAAKKRQDNVTVIAAGYGVTSAPLVASEPDTRTQPNGRQKSPKTSRWLILSALLALGLVALGYFLFQSMDEVRTLRANEESQLSAIDSLRLELIEATQPREEDQLSDVVRREVFASLFVEEDMGAALEDFIASYPGTPEAEIAARILDELAVLEGNISSLVRELHEQAEAETDAAQPAQPDEPIDAAPETGETTAQQRMQDLKEALGADDVAAALEDFIAQYPQTFEATLAAQILAGLGAPTPEPQ